MATFVPRKGGILILLLFICFSVFLTEKINFIEFFCKFYSVVIKIELY